MKLFTKDINQKLFAQYRIGSNLNKQKVVAKIFNPYGEGRWYLLNSDPNDPDYLWAIVQMGNEVEIGSVSRRELESIRIKPFGLPLERDIYFNERIAMEVLDGLEKGQTFAVGGMTAGRWYKDNSGKEFRYIGESQGKLLFNDGEKIVYKDEEDFNDSPKEKKLFGFFEEGGETEEGVDLFEDYDEIPDNVQEILQKYDFEEGDYRTLEKAKKDVETVGYTFEYSLDGTAYDLRKIGQKGKSEDEEDYAKGGMVTLYDDYDKSAGYIIEKGNKYWTGKNWSDIKAYAESYKTKKEAEQKLKSTKMAKGGLLKISVSDIKDYDFQSLSQIFESNDAAFFIDEEEEYVLMDLKALPDGQDKEYAYEILGRYDVKKMAKGGEINWGQDLGDGFSIGNDVKITDTSSRFWNKYGYLVGKIGQRLVVRVGNDEMDAVVAKEDVKKLDAPMADGGTTKRTVKLTLSDKDSYDYTYKQDGATASITFGFGKEPFQYEVKKISKSLEPLKQDILDAFTIQGIKQHEYKGGFSEAIKHLDTKVVYEDNMAKGGETKINLGVDKNGKSYKVGDIISLRAYMYEIMKDDDGKIILSQLDSYYAPFGKNFQEGSAQFNDILKLGVIFSNRGNNMAKGGKVGDPISEDELKKLVERLSKKDKLDMQEYYALSKAKYNLERINKGKMAKGGKLVGKQKNLDVNKNGKLDAEDFKMLRGEKMAMGGNTQKAFEVILKNPNGGMTEKAILLAKTKEDASKKALNLKEYKQYGYVVNSAEEIKYAMGGKVKFEDKVKAIKESLLKRKKVSPKVQKDYGKTYSPKEAEESATRIAASQRLKYELKKKFKKGGRTIAQTPAPKKDRVFGSSKNKPGSASSKKAASKIELNESIVKTLTEKAKEYNEKHSSKVSTSTLKAVMRRGMGAYSTSHRPTITGGAPNSRQAWGFARVNKFLKKKGGAQVKAAYVQDDDLL